jgi:hypothetical protein
VPPLRGLICIYMAFPHLPVWATLFRAYGTLGDPEILHHLRTIAICLCDTRAGSIKVSLGGKRLAIGGPYVHSTREAAHQIQTNH